MLNFIDNFLNSITMYRLTLYYLILLLVVAFVYSFFGILPFGPISLLLSTLIQLAICFVANKIFEKIFKVQTNFESLYITALILTLIITPVKIFSFQDIGFLLIVGIVAMASKYILAINRKHIFNPAAIAVLISAFTIHRYASWWIGTLAMFPWVLLGILIVKKIRRFDLVFYFLIANIIMTLVFRHSILISFIDSPILFFAFVMLTEPLTTPPTKLLQSFYGAITGFTFMFTPEIALIIGNIFSYIVSPKEKLILSLKEKVKLTDDIYDFVFTSAQKLRFKAGQYLEWTLSQKKTDSRGNRRYFTISSSPTENEIRIGVKFNKNGSTFKNEMLSMKIGHEIVASQLAGDFTIQQINKKFVFIAGGIGITPFRSIIKNIIDTNQKGNIVLIYCEKNFNEMVYKDVFDMAKNYGVKVIYFQTEKEGHINSQILKRQVSDFRQRTFYLSGPHAMVTSFEKVLSELHLQKSQIKVDYFPGF
jgi:ferredoxin-NADP reductase